MGINTVAVLFNDQTNEFRRSGPLGERIADAMTAGWSMRDRDRLATWFGCGQVISQAHADYSQVVVVTAAVRSANATSLINTPSHRSSPRWSARATQSRRRRG